MKYIDVHCHVNLPQYDADRDEVIRRAHEAGVGMIVVGTDAESSEKAVKLAEQHENMWAIVGLHPSDASGVGESSGETFDFDFYKKLASHPKVVGIGECGLDYFHADPEVDENRLVQVQTFENHIRLAHELNKPLMLHVRNGKSNSATNKSPDAYADVIAILEKSKATGINVTGDVHFFAGDVATARRFIDLGFYLSFTGVITFPRAESYHEVIRAMPLDRILSETDAPFVSPVPYRGKRNEPAYVVEVAKAIARIRSSEDESIVMEVLITNAKDLFKIDI
jgi:TatD DNase family protein